MIEEQGGRALAVRCDVTRADDVKAALEKTNDAFGRLDVPSTTRGLSRRSRLPRRTTTKTSGTGSSIST